MGNLSIYEKYRAVPENAQKTIKGGRLKGMTDINPMWRIKCLTEEFGPCGIGWKTDVLRQWIEEGANGEKAAFCNINLYVKVDGAWSEAIFGTGGAMFVASEKSGLYTDDEVYKKAYTDAISVACKSLGFGADVYWAKDSTKYTRGEDREDDSLRVGALRLEIEQICEDRNYLQRMAVKNCSCDYDAMNAQQLAGLLKFLQLKKNAAAN